MRRMLVAWLGASLGVVMAQGRPVGGMAAAVQAAEALGARTGVLVAEQDGRVLFRHRADEGFAPASNQKLLTAAAVVRGLGPDFRFVTTFRLVGGRLEVLASGDPNWIGGTAHAPEAVFGEVAAALQRLQVGAVRGIDLQPGAFTGPSRPSTWPADQLQTYYCAPTGPFVLDQGTFTLETAVGRDGSATVAIASPRCGMPVRGGLELVDRAKGAVYGAIDMGSHVQVRGKLYRKARPATIRTAVADPATWYLAGLRQVLQQAGIAVAADAPAVDGPVLEYRSELGPALLRMLEDSSNFDAEQCLRVLGAQRRQDGSLAGGLAELQRMLAELLGAPPKDLSLLDGSGLSRDNRLSPAALLAVLQASQQGPGAKLLRECLPVAGRSGTLEDRFVGTDLIGRVRAKTGWIRGASALSGCVERRDGTRRWFVILMNYDPKQNGLNKDLKALQESLVAAIDREPPA